MELISVDRKSRKPIFEQLVDNIGTLVVSGLMQPDEQLPSVRSLSYELAINPNTIQKAYAELERRGVVYSIPGRGSFISTDTAALTAKRREEILAEFAALTRRAHELSIDRDSIIKIIRENGGNAE